MEVEGGVEEMEMVKKRNSKRNWEGTGGGKGKREKLWRRWGGR